MPSDPTTDVTLFGSVTLTPEQALARQQEARETERGLERSKNELFDILPVPEIQLTETEQAAVTRQRLSAIVMDAAGVAALRCEDLCPFRDTCSLYRSGKHPLNQLCPWEVDYLRERFLGWLREFGRTLDTVLESERVAIGNLCSLQLELQRVRKVLARGRNAEMNQVSVRDVNAQTGEPICWENVIHTAAQREDQILLNIRMIMKDFELTPEQKTRKAKALGLRSGNDIANKQSAVHDKIRQNRSGPKPPPVIEEAVQEVAVGPSPGPIR